MKNKILAFALIIIASIIITDCVSFKAKYYHDYDNPCYPGEYRNMVECENWQKKYPKEFERYKKRMGIDQVEKDSIN